MSNPGPEITGLHNCGYYNTSFLQEVESEIQSKVFQVQAGVDTFTKTEKLVYEILKRQGFFRPVDEPVVYTGD